jgi:hypothetical protein
MNITTTKRHIIKLEQDEAKRNLISSFIDLLHDDCRDEEVDMVESDINRLTDCLQMINKGNFKEVFKEGYTMMILPPAEFKYVEDFFREHSNNDELNIILTNKDGTTAEVVPHHYLSY